MISSLVSCCTSVWYKKLVLERNLQSQHEIFHSEYLKDNVGLWRALAMENAQKIICICYWETLSTFLGDNKAIRKPLPWSSSSAGQRGHNDGPRFIRYTNTLWGWSILILSSRCTDKYAFYIYTLPKYICIFKLWE